MGLRPVRYPPEQLRLRRLIRAGYFPVELPPPFTTVRYARHAVRFAAQWDASAILKFRTLPEHYSIPRYGHVRRKLSIVNPVNQLYVARLISENWPDIRRRLQRSRITEFRPEIILQGPGRAVSGVDFDGVSRRRAELLAQYGRYVKTDIARFYPSVYTHSIAWAVHGKDWVKQNFSSKAFKTSFSNSLDKAVASGQAGQTIGIPIGPDTSRIISELIATELEEITRREIPDLDSRAVRYIDDMLIGLNDSETPDAILAKLSAALYEYELELSGEKTSMHGVGCEHAPEWIHFIRSFLVSGQSRRQREDLDSFFEQAFYLADRNRVENVLLFAAKRAVGFVIVDRNRDHLIRWLLYSARRSSTCLSFIVEHLSSLHAQGAALPMSEIAHYINQQIPLHAEAAHHAEVAWLILWARELNLTLEASVLTRATRLRSGVIALLTFDMLQRGLIVGQVDTSFWRSFANAKGLASEMWLCAYEITKKGWWSRPKKSDYVTSHEFFGHLWARDVEFYDPTRRARRPVEPRFLVALRAAAEITSPYAE